MEQVNLTVNVVSKKASERVMRYSRLYRDIERLAEKTNPPEMVIRRKEERRSNRWILNASAARLGQAYKETSDKLQRNSLEASASVINSVGGNNGDLPTEAALSDLDDIVSLLQDNDGEYITNMVDASDRIGTSPLGDAYTMMCTSKMTPVLNNITGFRRKFEYGTGAINTLSSEWGGVNNIRAFISSQGSISPNASLLGNDVANNIITAQEGYKIVFQAGGRAKYIYTPPGFNNDPAHLRQTAACQFYQGECINQDLWVQNLLSTGI